MFWRFGLHCNLHANDIGHLGACLGPFAGSRGSLGLGRSGSESDLGLGPHAFLRWGASGYGIDWYASCCPAISIPQRAPSKPHANALSLFMDTFLAQFMLRAPASAEDSAHARTRARARCNYRACQPQFTLFWTLCNIK